MDATDDTPQQDKEAPDQSTVDGNQQSALLPTADDLENPEESHFWSFMKAYSEMVGDELMHSARRSDSPEQLARQLRYWATAADMLATFADAAAEERSD